MRCNLCFEKADPRNQLCVSCLVKVQPQLRKDAAETRRASYVHQATTGKTIKIDWGTIFVERYKHHCPTPRPERDTGPLYP